MPKVFLSLEDARLAAGAPRSPPLKPPLPLMRDPLPRPVSQPRCDRATNAQLEEAAFTANREKAPVRGDQPRDTAKHCLVDLDRRDQEAGVRSRLVHADVGHDAALGLLNFDDCAKLRRSIEFPLTDDLRPGL